MKLMDALVSLSPPLCLSESSKASHRTLLLYSCVLPDNEGGWITKSTSTLILIHCVRICKLLTCDMTRPEAISMREQRLNQQLPAFIVSAYPTTSLYLTFNLLQVWVSVSNNSKNLAGFTLLP